jgi:hypothetical protein
MACSPCLRPYESYDFKKAGQNPPELFLEAIEILLEGEPLNLRSALTQLPESGRLLTIARMPRKREIAEIKEYL